jgi:Uma2 family endonuclease
MATATTTPATLDDFLRAEAAAPEGTRLALIDGEIVEWGANMTTRGSWHSFALARLSYLLCDWLGQPNAPVGVIGTGEVRCRIEHDPERIVGIDVGIWLGEEFCEPPSQPPLYDVPPALAVEVLSPSDTNEDIWEKVHTYLNAGVSRVWIVDPELKTVTVHRSDAEPTLFNINHTIADDPALPGLTLAVADIFRSRSPVKQP